MWSMEATHLEQMMATPEEVSVDTAIASVISELEGISSLKEEQRKDVFVLLPGGFGFDSVPCFTLLSMKIYSPVLI